jgi:membrane protein DedA with SNARE-associated domain
MPYGRFLAYNVAGAILWTVACVFLGYLLGEAWPVAEK